MNRESDELWTWLYRKTLIQKSKLPKKINDFQICKASIYLDLGELFGYHN